MDELRAITNMTSYNADTEKDEYDHVIEKVVMHLSPTTDNERESGYQDVTTYRIGTVNDQKTAPHLRPA